MSRVEDPREKMANQLLMRGHATMKELLTASFGEWPPKGLDINPDITHDQKIVFRPLLDATKDSRREKNIFLRWLNILNEQTGIAGRGSLGDDRIIYINRFILCTLPKMIGGGPNSTMGHEALHVLQGDHYWRAQETFGEEAAQNIWTTQKDAASNAIMKKLSAFEEKLPKNRLKQVFNAVTFYLRGGNTTHYDMGIEVQARTHQIMLDGYARWGKMPQDRMELFAALTNAGLEPPAGIAQRLASLPKDSSARHFLSANAGSTSAARDIRALNRSLSKPAKDMFWRETLPALYADLIEMYGDRLGRERFGLGVNPKREFRQKMTDKNQPAPA